MHDRKEQDLQYLRDIVDLLMPELTPYESALYILLFRMSFLQSNSPETRVGKKMIAAKLGKSSRAAASISFSTR